MQQAQARSRGPTSGTITNLGVIGAGNRTLKRTD